jgi:AcrR family transcriptional regulator
MDKAQKISVWTEVGYTIFAEEGRDGIQVERLARILQLNKSGFYHYFGDLEIFFEELLKLHSAKADIFFAELQDIKTIDPEYLCLLVKYKISNMFHMQLIRSPQGSSFYNAAKKLDDREDDLLSDLWSDYLGLNERPDLAIRYFDVVRDMFYARLGLQNFNYPFLHNLMTEAKTVMQQITENRELESDESSLPGF